MSLLMDALRKAEQERKEAAKRAKESEDGLHMENGATGDQQSANAAANTPETQQDQAGETGLHDVSRSDLSTSMELSLAPLEQAARENHAERREAEDGADRSGDVSGRHAAPHTSAGSADITSELDIAGDDDESPPGMEELEQESPDQDLDQTFHGISLEQDETPEMFEATVQDEVFAEEELERRYEETLPGVPAMQLAKDIGSEDQPTPVAAQTVFTAGDTTRSGRTSGFKWLLIGSGLTVILAGSVWYYYIVTPITRDLPSPMVAKGIETVAASQPSPDLRSRLESASGNAPAEQPGPAPPAATTGAITGQAGMNAAGSSGASAAAAGNGGQTTAAPPPVTANTATSAPEQGAATAAAPPPGAKPAQTQEQNPVRETANAETPPAPDGGTAPAAGKPQAAEALPESIELSPDMIRISHSKTPDLEGVQLQQAYAAYRAGDYSGAADKYRKVLDNRPDNRDALLGLGAVALKNGDKNRALQVYTRLLRLNPQDKLVRSILINLSNSTDLSGSESAVKVMLQDHPDQPFLYFTLGNLYATQSRWPDAQQAFFNAYHLDSDNADYALNLAVSLDHLGHPDAALKYYRTAVQLARKGNASFDPAALQARIETLEGLQKQ